jgi:hypothetical protein
MVSYCVDPDCDIHNNDLFNPPQLAPLISCCLFIVVGLAIFAVIAIASVITLINIKG